MKHSEIIDKWPSQATLADDLQVSLSAVKMMKHRNRIRDRYWSDLIASARKRRITGVTVAALMKGIR